MKRRIKYLLLPVVMFLALTLQKTNAAFSLQDVEFTLKLENATIKQVLKEIERQSKYTFVYNDAEIDSQRRISINIKAMSIEQALNAIFSDTGISYRIIKQQIVLTKNKQSGKSIKVSGLVSDAKTNAPIPGVNVIIKGTTQGTITDLDGKYSLEAPDENGALVFSFIGYKTKEVPIKGRSSINVSLQPKSEELSELVVVGYGTESRALLTSSVGAVSADEIKDRPTPSLSGALQGKTAGVQVTQNSGTPGGGISVRIRGVSSISAGNEPLYIVDGIPIITGNYGQVSFGGQGINAISDLNPNEIESISVLRDASAAAIYGARASNGVVLITTKRGKSGSNKINFSAYYGVQDLENSLDMLNAQQWKEYKNDQALQDGAEQPYSQEDISDNNIDTDWIDEIIRVAPVQNYEMSASGGNEKAQYFISGSYFDQDGIVLGTDYQKLNGRINLDYTVNNKLKIGSSFGIAHTANNRKEGDQSLNSPLANAITLPPVYPVYNDDGTYNEDHEQLANPVAIANHHTNEAFTFRNIGNIYVEYKILKNLTFKTKWGVDYMNLREHSYSPITTRQGKKYDGLSIEATNEATNIVSNNTLHYTPSLGEGHSFNILAGYSFEKYANRSTYLRGQGFPNEMFEYIVSAAEVTEGSVTVRDRALNSYFGQIKYNYRDKYLFSFTSRYDGSSKFGENNRYGFFPALSLGWRVTEESFFNVNQISNLKLRFSFGMTGNDGISDFESIGLFSGGYNYMAISGTAPSQLPNPDLKWETTAQFDFGFDLGLFKNRIALDFDYYLKKTKDLLLSRPIPTSSGFSSITSNIGELENKGFELGLTTENLKGEFSWTSTFNFSANRNKVTKLYNGQPLDNVGRGGNRVQEGEPIAVFYNWVALGVDPSTGDIVFDDINGDGEITTADRTVIGNPHPDFTGGITNNFSYKGFTLSVFLQYSYGNDIYNAARRYIENLKGGDNQLAVIVDRWRQPGDVTEIPRATSSDPNLNNRHSSRFVENGSYLRIKNMKLGYHFPQRILDKVRISKLEIYCTGQNLMTFTGYSGMDPEVNYAGQSTTRIGTDFFTYPQARSITFGINLGL